MKIFPAIDIKDKKCVRLVKGDFDNKTEYEMSPLEQAGKYEDHGFKNLHIVDSSIFTNIPSSPIGLSLFANALRILNNIMNKKK